MVRRGPSNVPSQHCRVSADHQMFSLCVAKCKQDQFQDSVPKVATTRTTIIRSTFMALTPQLGPHVVQDFITVMMSLKSYFVYSS